jgi:hypothetical protein
MVFIQTNALALMTRLQQSLHNPQMPQRTSQMQIGITISRRREGGEIGVVEEVGVGFDDSGYERRVGGVDGAAETEGGVDPFLSRC